MLNWNSLLQRITHWLSYRQKSIWLVLSVLVVTFFLAKSINLVVAYFYLPPELNFSENNSQTRLPNSLARVDIRRITERNLFDSSAKKQINIQPSEPTINDQELKPTSLNIELLATVVFRNSRYSVALMNDRSSNSTRYYSIGDRIQGANVVRIERFRVIIRRAGRLEFAEIQAAKSKIEDLQPARKTPTSPTTTKTNLEEISPGRFAIPEETVSGLLKDLPSILKQARAIPVNGAGGKLDGFKIVEIKNDSIFEKIGIQNGDVVKRVNDDNLDSIEKGMSLFTALRNEKTISIDIDRGGTRLNYTYEIR